MAIDLGEVLTAENKFSVLMFMQIRTVEQGNIMFCPLTMMNFLTWLYCGSGGSTKERLAKILRLEDVDTHVKGLANLTGNFLEQPCSFQDTINVYLNSDFDLVPRLVQIAEELKISFEPIPTDIPSLIQINNNLNCMHLGADGESSSSDPTKYVHMADDLVIVNTVYMKAPWFSSFTLLEGLSDFITAKGDTVQVQMMTNILHCHYKEDDELKATIVVIPLQCRKLSMIVINPNESGDIDEIIYKFNDYGFQSVFDIEHFTTCNLKLTLPKFKMQSKVDFRRLKKFTGLFDQRRCNLTQLVEVNSPTIITMLQRVTFEVDEKGDPSATAGPSKETKVDKVINVNRPFLFVFYVHDSATPYGLMYGKVSDPSK